ncbi:hypothetical protein [Candidatus Enterococcus ferrettii]|uniref:Uncharacterized protein n=1 Tax=Candidatus Enterococcus ferrettii TaxID=2815324 RepID=A0ABV0EUC5_9ENTE|nr:hypothetical protein [Enterococcus sp. 665A]MBO1339461.1 hypothetical protein [Enterococcus sp. 665A]
MEKNKTAGRKRNKSVKTAVLLFGAVLITTSLLGGTLAKYVSELGSAKDEARVAKWGITEESQSLNMFKTAYDDISGAAANTVESKDGAKVMAPGTKGDVVLSPAISDAKLNNVEVAFKVNYGYGDFASDSVYGKYLGKWASQADGTGFEWWPLRFKVYSFNETSKDYTDLVYDGISTSDSGGTQINPDDGGIQIDKLNAAIKAAGSSDTIYPNDSLVVKKEKLAKMGVKIEWQWPFERPETGSVTAVDGWDTVVGNRAASLNTGDTDMPRFVMSMKYNAVQVD